MEKKTKINLKKKHTQQIKLKRWSRFLALFIICLPCISILLVALSSFLYVSCVCVCKFGFFFSFFNNFNFYLFYFSPHSRDCILPFNCLVFHYRHLLPIESFPVFSPTSFYSVFFSSCCFFPRSIIVACPHDPSVSCIWKSILIFCH